VIINGKCCCNGAFFAKHLTNNEMNRDVRLADIRGMAAKNIGQAFYEMRAVASGTRCKNFFYHAHLNPLEHELLTPEQWERAVDELEKSLGLEGQPRFVVEHDKKGRVHRHVVWSRIDVDRMRAIPNDNDYAKHQAVARKLEKEFGLKQGKSVLGPEAEKGQRPERRPKQWEVFRGQVKGVNVKEFTAEITGLWRSADSAEAFVSALEGRGYILAQGDSRTYCVVDRNGDIHSLARRIEGVKTAEVKERLSGINPKLLPHAKVAAAYQREQASKAQDQEREAFVKREEQQRQETVEQEGKGQQQTLKDEEERQQQAVQDEEQWRQAGVEAESRRQEEAKNAERQAEQSREMEAQQERLDHYKAAMAGYAERARREAEQRKSEDMDARIREREIRNAGHRYGEALGQHYSIRDPYESMARAAMAEYGALIRERSKLEAQISKTSDPVERQRLELRKRIESADYMALTSERIAAQSEVIIGRSDTPEAVRQRARAKSFQEEAQALRKEYREVVIEQSRGKGQDGEGEKSKGGSQEQGPHRQEEKTTQSKKSEQPKGEQEKGQAKDQRRTDTREQQENTQKTERKGADGPSILVEEKTVGKARGKVQKLSDFVKTVPPKPAHREFTADEINNNPEAKKAYYAQLKNEKNRELSLNQISKDLKWGNNLKAQDIKDLSRDDIEGIKRGGDKYLREIVQRHEQEREKGRGLER